MYKMTKNGTQDNDVTYEFFCDSNQDLQNIDPHYITLGSTAIILNQGALSIYIANSNKEWIDIGTSGEGE